jgi:hypothetical protein
LIGASDCDGCKSWLFYDPARCEIPVMTAPVTIMRTALIGADIEVRAAKSPASAGWVPSVGPLGMAPADGSPVYFWGLMAAMILNLLLYIEEFWRGLQYRRLIARPGLGAA